MHRMNRTPACKNRPPEHRQGAILAMILIVVVVVALMGSGLLALTSQSALATARTLNATKAFWLAEAAVQRFDKNAARWDGRVSIGTTAFGEGTYRVDAVMTGLYAVASATVQGETQQIRVGLGFLGKLFEHAIFSGNAASNSYALQMRGTGNPAANGSSGERGGKDIVYGKLYVNGDVRLYDQSYVSNALAPNAFNIKGDVEATGRIYTNNSSKIYGSLSNNVPSKTLPVFPDYAQIATYNVSAEFARYNITSGYLPAGHPLRDLVVKNPSSRSAECADTPGDDYFFEPRTVSNSGTWKTAVTPLNLGDNKIYYVDGDAWFNHPSTYGFKVSGKATIAASANIHISDNLAYASTNDMLGLVAVGKLEEGELVNKTGDVFFGDPRYGTVYTVDAFMFARNDFQYVTWGTDGAPREPDSGFQIDGNYGALGKININRDWFDLETIVNKKTVKTPWPAVYDPVARQWTCVDKSYTTRQLTSSEGSSLRHYQMVVAYDDRIRNPLRQPPGLPQQPDDPSEVYSASIVYSGFVKWDAWPFN